MINEVNFMEMAIAISQKSKDPITKVGAVYTRIDLGGEYLIGKGYNKMVDGADYPWKRPDKYDYVIHAEIAALRQANYIAGATLYTTLHPCKECSKILVFFGIKKIYYLEDKYECKISHEIFDNAKIERELWKEQVCTNSI